MHEHLLPPQALAFLSRLTRIQPPPISIWLIGSRANGRHHATSDTDLLVFADPGFATNARQTLPPPTGIDVLVVYDGNQFSDVWQRKTGSLKALRWRQRDIARATYFGRKFVPDDDTDDDFPPSLCENTNVESGEFIERDELALLLWSGDAS